MQLIILCTFMFCKAIVIVIAALHCSFQLRKKLYCFTFPHKLFAPHLHCVSEFAIKKKLLAAQLARRATCDLKTLARRIIPLAPGYRTALLSRPARPQFMENKKVQKNPTKLPYSDHNFVSFKSDKKNIFNSFSQSGPSG